VGRYYVIDFFVLKFLAVVLAFEHQAVGKKIAA
jgi:hypothetical protein